MTIPNKPYREMSDDEIRRMTREERATVANILEKEEQFKRMVSPDAVKIAENALDRMLLTDPSRPPGPNNPPILATQAEAILSNRLKVLQAQQISPQIIQEIFKAYAAGLKQIDYIKSDGSPDTLKLYNSSAAEFKAFYDNFSLEQTARENEAKRIQTVESVRAGMLPYDALIAHQAKVQKLMATPAYKSAAAKQAAGRPLDPAEEAILEGASDPAGSVIAKGVVGDAQKRVGDGETALLNARKTRETVDSDIEFTNAQNRFSTGVINDLSQPGGGKKFYDRTYDGYMKGRGAPRPNGE